jgi:hypothetical protein
VIHHPKALVWRGFTVRKRRFCVIPPPENVDFTWLCIPKTLILRGAASRKRCFYVNSRPGDIDFT